MRPKKVVLCVAADEQVLSCRVFLLETRGYAVLRASSLQKALAVLRGPRMVDVLVTELMLAGADDGDDLVRVAKELRPELRTMIVSDRHHFRDSSADAFLAKEQSSPGEVVERVRILSARKRGPRGQRAAIRHHASAERTAEMAVTA